MKKVAFACALLFLAGLSAPAQDKKDKADKKDGKDGYEMLIQEMIKTMTQAGDVLSAIKDKATADAAKPKLKGIGKSLQDLQQRAQKLGPPSADEQAALEKKYKEKLETAAKKFQAELLRVMNVEGGKEALAEMSPKKDVPKEIKKESK